jgi:hypothetical protein
VEVLRVTAVVPDTLLLLRGQGIRAIPVTQEALAEIRLGLGITFLEVRAAMRGTAVLPEMHKPEALAEPVVLVGQLRTSIVVKPFLPIIRM